MSCGGPLMSEIDEGEAVMPFVNGIRFRCDCGANVFTRLTVFEGKVGSFYRCNGCRSVYEGM